MGEYQQKIFYNPKPVLKHLDQFKKEVVEKSYEIILEEKYQKSSRREPTEKSLERILKLCKKKEDIRILHEFANFPDEKEKFQVVFMYDWYFAWCSMEPECEKYFVDKYQLIKL